MTDRYLGSTSNEIRQKYTYTQAENFRLTALQSGTCASGYTNLQNISYSYDDQGNVLTVVDAAAFGGSQTQTFTYDALNRLLTAQAAGGSHGTYAQRSYVYNNAGNIDSFEGVTQHYLDGAHKHAVTHVGGTTEAHRKYWYDQNGNATRRINGSQDITLAYDAENHVTSITGSGINASYVYDGDGNRVKATFGSTTTVYVGNYYERDNGTTVRKYYYTGGVRVAMRSGGQTSYLLSDHLGGTNVTANGTNGAELGRVLYRPWGETRLSSGSTPTTWRFTGQREDATIGLYYFNARYLDPQLGRFTQPDTIVPEPGNPQALNWYSYVLNNPLRYTDSTGMFSEDQIMASLIDQYGAKEARRIWNLWLLDAAWMNALYEADFQSTIWASQFGFGTFDQASEGSPRITIRLQDQNKSDSTVDLWQFQGKGGYQVSSQTHVVKETSCHVGACFQPIFEYDSRGRIVGNEPVRWQHSAWVQPLFGINPFWFAEGSTAVRAPWKFTASYAEDSAGTVVGWFVPVIDIGQDLERMFSPVFPLTVASIPYPTSNGGVMEPYNLPKAFRP